MNSEEFEDDVDLKESESVWPECGNPEGDKITLKECETRLECRTRSRTEKGLYYNLVIATKKKNKASISLRSRMQGVDMSLKNSEDLDKLMAGKDGLEADINSFKSLHEDVIDLLIKLDLDENQEKETADYTALFNACLECLADVRTRIKDQELERAELLSQRSSRFKKSLASARTTSTSSSSSKRAAIEVATLKVKMESLQRRQEIDRRQDELRRQQRELEG